MSYQVLARKWRPRLFTEMVGQEHVLRALINGLDNDRIHHAYLFAGTRGVGKTTIARILAKCLNCEQGVSSTPCGECGACREIGEGRFVDLIEVDAASRTKVEDTRELLDNVQYAPTRGRYKIYLIDEVHMLSSHSFNALLKTLEEPPPHVKFLLATTDPQKLPVTVLSRCLQFNLKNLGPERIVEHLKFILGEEKIPFEETALWDLGRAADGSMRDALSLTDQAIAHGGGTLTATEVNAMLGTIDRSAVVDLCRAVAGGDPARVMAGVERLADHSPDYSAALADMLSVWHQVAIAQTMPDALDPVQEHHDVILELAETASREDIQLLYQITLLGRKDLPYAADPRSGFEMVLLRLLAFKPELPDQSESPAGGRSAQGSGAASPAKKPEPVAGKVFPHSGNTGELPRAAPAVNPVPAPERVADPAPATPASISSPAPESRELRPSGEARTRNAESSLPGDRAEDCADDYESYAKATADRDPQDSPVKAADVFPGEVSAGPEGAEIEPAKPAGRAVSPPGERAEAVPLGMLTPTAWVDVCRGLGQGLLPTLAANMTLESVDGNVLQLTLDRNSSALYAEGHDARMTAILSDYFGEQVRLRISVGAPAAETPRQIAERLRAERLQKAVGAIRADRHVQELCRVFDAELVESSVKPIDRTPANNRP